MHKKDTNYIIKKALEHSKPQEASRGIYNTFKRFEKSRIIPIEKFQK
jgi:hypothetical protein